MTNGLGIKSGGKPTFLTTRLPYLRSYLSLRAVQSKSNAQPQSARGQEGGLSTPAGPPRRGPRLAPDLYLE
jgi:hypothetical protein